MEYRSLGRTGVQVSKLCLGCLNFGAATGPEDSQRMIDRALDAGINFFDTANSYGRGTSEETVGEALRRNGQRDRVVLATKVHSVMDDDDPNMRGSQRRHIVQQCDESLRRLQTDYIDLYQLHRPQPSIPIDETLRALDDLIRAGKVRYIGSSTFAAWQVMEALWASKELGLNRFVTEQPPYHILERRVERELVPMALTYGIGIIPWSPTANGLLAGRFRRGEPVPEGARFKPGDARLTNRRMLEDATFDAIDAVAKLASEKGCKLVELAVAWLASRPGVTAPIIGPRTMDHLESYLGALDVEVTAEDERRIDAISPPGRALTPYYEADFGPHLHRL